MKLTDVNNARCAIGCAGCRTAEASIPGDAPAGWRLVLPAFLGFVLPALAALAGAAVWPQPGSGIVGGVGGLIAGGLVGAVATWALRSRLARRGA